jgi:hypothetical protein
MTLEITYDVLRNFQQKSFFECNFENDVFKKYYTFDRKRKYIKQILQAATTGFDLA